MIRRVIGRLTRLAVIAVTPLIALDCGGGQGPSRDPTAGTVAGSVNGPQWTALSNAYWIGRPAMGSPPVILFLFAAR